MENKGTLTKIMAISGTLVFLIPILMPVFFAAIRLVQARRLLFDFLMPAEIFPVVLVGAVLLVWAALRAHSRRAWILWSFGLALAGLLAALGLASAFGLDSGPAEPSGLPFMIVIACFVLFWLGLIGTAIGGILLWRDLARAGPAAAS